MRAQTSSGAVCDGRATGLDLRHLLCSLGRHRYRYEGVMLGNRLERCSRCGKVRVKVIAAVTGRPADSVGRPEDCRRVSEPSGTLDSSRC